MNYRVRNTLDFFQWCNTFFNIKYALDSSALVTVINIEDLSYVCLFVCLCLCFFVLIFRSFEAVIARRSSSFILKISSKAFIRNIQMGTNQNSILQGCNSNSRGALVVLEGLDRCGKTTQSSRLVQYLEGLGHSAELWRFPDRTTSVGQMISSYLSNKSQLDDHTIHLLFSANRWEKRFVNFS